MSNRSASTAPFHIPGARTPPGSFGPPDQAPSLGWGGMGLQDPRLPYNSANSATAAGIIGWFGSGLVRTVAQVPAALSATNIALAQAVTSGTPMVLTAGAGVSVVPAGGFLCLPSMNVIPAGALVLDGLPGYVTFGTQPTSFRSLFYNPGTMLSRAPSVTGSASALGGNINLYGWDTYGYPTSQQLFSSAGITNNGTKTIKFLGSAVPQFTDAGNTYSLGTADRFGFPLFLNLAQDAIINWNNAFIFGTLTKGATTPSSITTGDPRGAVVVGNPSNGVKVYEVWQSVAIEAAGPTGLFPGNLVNAMFGYPQA